MITEQEQSAIGKQSQPALQPPPGATVAVRPLPSRAPDEIFLHIDLLRSLFQQRWLAIGVICAGIAIAAGYVVKTGPTYSAQSQVYIQPAPPRLMQTGSGNVWPSDSTTYESYIQQQIQNMSRSDVLLLALKKMPSGSWRKPKETEQQAAERLGHAIEVTRLGSSYQVSIVSHADTSALAAEICNAVASGFIEVESRELRAGDPQRIELLSGERDRIQKALADDRAEQESLNKQLGVAEVGAASPNPYDEQIREVRLELVKARTASDQASARLTTITGGSNASSAALDAEADEMVAADAGLVSMKKSLNERRAVLIARTANLTPSHPQYKQDAEELEKSNASLSAMAQDLRGKVARNIEQRLKNDLERTSTVEARLNAQLGRLTGAALGASPRLQRSEELITDIQRLQNRYTAVDEQFRNLTLESKAPGAAYVSALAVPPLHAATGPVLRKVLMFLLGTLVFAVIAAVAAQNLDPRVYIAADVERVLGFSPIAQLPDFREVSNAVSEEYMLRLAGAIEHAYQHGGLKSCIFTGVGPGAGVTTVATRVRTMLEGMGRTTVLVEASGTPSPAAAGPADAQGSTNLVTTGMESGPSALLQQMAEEMDSETIVLTDTAPLLASGETEYLARFVDSAIVVIQSGLTTRAQLREIAQTLQRLEVAAVGFVLNRVSIKKASPSFRQSVRAVEQRLSVQNLLRARHSPRPRPSAQHQRESAQEPSVVTDPDPVKLPDFDLSPDTSPRPGAAAPSAVPPPASDVRGPDSMAAEPESVAAGTPRFARGRGDVQRPAAAPRVPRPPAEAPLPVATAPDSAPPAFAPSPRRAVAPPFPVAAPPPPPAGVAAAPPVSPAAPPPSPPSATVPPADRWTPPPPAAPSPVRPAPAAKSDPVPDDLVSERDDSGYVAASRLGGLRNLLVSLGRKSLNNDGEPENEADIEPRFQRTVRPAYPDAALPAADAPENASPARLTAQPEFLPPKPMIEVAKENEIVRATPPRRDNVDPDEIQTLPSWRGQYRKKKYPPL